MLFSFFLSGSVLAVHTNALNVSAEQMRSSREHLYRTIRDIQAGEAKTRAHVALTKMLTPIALTENVCTQQPAPESRDLSQ